MTLRRVILGYWIVLSFGLTTDYMWSQHFLVCALLLFPTVLLGVVAIWLSLTPRSGRWDGWAQVTLALYGLAWLGWHTESPGGNHYATASAWAQAECASHAGIVGVLLLGTVLAYASARRASHADETWIHAADRLFVAAIPWLALTPLALTAFRPAIDNRWMLLLLVAGWTTAVATVGVAFTAVWGRHHAGQARLISRALRVVAAAVLLLVVSASLGWRTPGRCRDIGTGPCDLFSWTGWGLIFCHLAAMALWASSSAHQLSTCAAPPLPSKPTSLTGRRALASALLVSVLLFRLSSTAQMVVAWVLWPIAVPAAVATLVLVLVPRAGRFDGVALLIVALTGLVVTGGGAGVESAGDGLWSVLAETAPGWPIGVAFTLAWISVFAWSWRSGAAPRESRSLAAWLFVCGVSWAPLTPLVSRVVSSDKWFGVGLFVLCPLWAAAVAAMGVAVALLSMRAERKSLPTLGWALRAAAVVAVLFVVAVNVHLPPESSASDGANNSLASGTWRLLSLRSMGAVLGIMAGASWWVGRKVRVYEATLAFRGPRPGGKTPEGSVSRTVTS
jgi:hypothetical protein